MQNSERDSTLYSIPAGEYIEEAPRVTSSARSIDNVVSFEERLSEARAQVDESYYSARPKHEKIDETVLEIISLRGQELEDARDNHLAANPYKYPIHGQPILTRVLNIAKNSVEEPTSKKDLIEEESQIGAKIFQIEGFRFFNTHPKHWWAHHDRPDLTETTIHYELIFGPQERAQGKGVLKCSSEALVQNQFIAGAELANFEKATETYHKLVLNRYNYKSRLDNHETYSAKKAA